MFGVGRITRFDNLVDIAYESIAKPFLTLFGLENSENVVVSAFDNRISFKYFLELDPTPSNIDEFYSKLLHGRLSPFFKSQTVPYNRDAGVHVVVGKTFDDLVLNIPKNILLERDLRLCYGPFLDVIPVVTEQCVHAMTSKQIEKLANRMKGYF